MKKITVLLVEPGKTAHRVEIDSSLKSMQKIVGGLIQPLYPFKDQVALVCNDDGKLLGLPLNRAIYNEDGKLYDAVVGTFFVCDASGESFGSLSDEMIEKYDKRFHDPETFLTINGEVVSIKFKEGK